MTLHRFRALWLALFLGLALAAGPVRAQTPDAATPPDAEAAPRPSPGEAAATAAPAAPSPAALARGRASEWGPSPQNEPWRYSTGYVFPLTRGLDGGPPTWRSPWLLLTVPFDTLHLPFGLLEGLFGE